MTAYRQHIIVIPAKAGGELVIPGKQGGSVIPAQAGIQGPSRPRE